jgi:dCTP deaminase
MTWNDVKLRQWIQAGGVTPANYDCINPASVDLHIDRHFIDLWTDEHLEAETLELKPGMAILATTVEVITIPPDAAATVYLKSSRARQGLDHALAGWIDPGFSGQITLELHAHRPFTITAGQRVIQLVLQQLIAPALHPYAGRYQHQRGPTPMRMECHQ